MSSRKADRAIHPAALPIEQLLQQCQIQTGRRSGPGGQHRNKVETAVVIKHLPTGITGRASERRSQAANREEAIHRMRLNLAVQIRLEKVPAETVDKPCELSDCRTDFHWSNRVKKGRILVAQDHQDFPAVIAGVLDDLLAHSWSPSDLAERFATSSSQLNKLLRTYPPALEVLNRKRTESGLSKFS
ncbi:MAG: peptide chain release factor-like protein [Pirellulales bacterium]